MKIIKAIIYLDFALCTLNFALFPRPAFAQSLSLSISPPIAEIMVMPGKQAIVAYTITNSSETDLVIIPKLVAFEPNGEEGLIRFSKSTHPISNYFSFDSGEKFEQPFSLKIGQEKQLSLKIAIPKDAFEADYYQTIVFSTQDLNNEADNNTGSITQIGSNLLLTISNTGEPYLSASIEEFSSLKIIDSFSPINFNLRIKNSGNTLFKPFGGIKITGWLDQKKEIKILEENILARSVRKISVEPYRPALPIGVFKAKVEFQPNELPPPVNQVITFIYLPYRLLLAVVGLVLIKIAFKTLRKKR